MVYRIFSLRDVAINHCCADVGAHLETRVVVSHPSNSSAGNIARRLLEVMRASKIAYGSKGAPVETDFNVRLLSELNPKSQFNNFKFVSRDMLPFLWLDGLHMLNLYSESMCSFLEFVLLEWSITSA